MKKLVIIFFYFICIWKIHGQDELKVQKIQAYFAFELSQPSYCNFVDFSIEDTGQYNIEDAAIEEIINEYEKVGYFNGKSRLEFISKMSVVVNGETISTVRYNEIIDDEVTAPKMFSSHPELPISEDLETVLLINSMVLAQIFRKSDDDDYPDINILKKKVKVSDNQVDVSKLAVLLRRDESLIEKYK